MATTPSSTGRIGSRGWLGMIREGEIVAFSFADARQALNAQLLAQNQGDYHKYNAQVTGMDQKIRALTKNPNGSIVDHVTSTVAAVAHHIMGMPNAQDALRELNAGDLTRYLPDPIQRTGLSIPQYEMLMSCSILAQEKTAVNEAIKAGLKKAKSLLTQDAQTLVSRVKGTGHASGSIPGRP